MTSQKQPTLADLTSRAMIASMNAVAAPDTAGDVEPHEGLAGVRTDTRAAWGDAQLAFQLLGTPGVVGSPPPEWAAFVDGSPGRLGIPMAAGQFPQRLRDVAGLFATDLVETVAPHSTGFAGLKAWIAQSQASDVQAANVLAVGIAREFGTANPATGTSEADQNERAAGLWLSGQCEDALAVWQSLPASPVTAFNTGMALLMLGRSKSAVAPLRLAIGGLPSASGWQHLASLYLSVAQARD